MIMDKIIVVISGFGLIAFIYWFFFGKRSEVVEASDEIEIVVSGGYKPDVIKLQKGVETKLRIRRTDANPCLEEFIIPDFRIKKYLPLDKNVEITLKPDKSGTWDFHCGMNMNHGKIIVD